jgi:hypothetical protein
MPTTSPTQGQSSHSLRNGLGHWVLPNRLPPPINPALLKHSEERAKAAQNRIADRITNFAGSMAFVYIHILWFAAWIGFGVEKYPFRLLTMIVSLEAIFLPTFVMISQNRADAKRQVIADAQWKTVQEEETQNQELLEISKQILQLTRRCTPSRLTTRIWAPSLLESAARARSGAFDLPQPVRRRPPLDDEHRGRLVEVGVHDVGDVGAEAVAVQSLVHRSGGDCAPGDLRLARPLRLGALDRVDRCAVQGEPRIATEIGALARVLHRAKDHFAVLERRLDPGDPRRPVGSQGRDRLVSVSVEQRTHALRELRLRTLDVMPRCHAPIIAPDAVLASAYAGAE